MAVKFKGTLLRGRIIGSFSILAWGRHTRQMQNKKEIPQFLLVSLMYERSIKQPSSCCSISWLQLSFVNTNSRAIIGTLTQIVTKAMLCVCIDFLMAYFSFFLLFFCGNLFLSFEIVYVLRIYCLIEPSFCPTQHTVPGQYPSDTWMEFCTRTDSGPLFFNLMVILLNICRHFSSKHSKEPKSSHKSPNKLFSNSIVPALHGCKV